MSPEVLKQVRSGVILLQTSMQPDFFLQPRDIPPPPLPPLAIKKNARLRFLYMLISYILILSL